ncbi:hypothetical protein OIU74_018699 [Salix koriyanagi]|uniref:MADS-box domain-containing protein n=1 Tax=Salix koriyanagi TaxID=2511006 RepID=A0A9Q1AIK9_9ROSI|nr:hypothetical protein OIU74_018699 [Salix koriyanagi]
MTPVTGNKGQEKSYRKRQATIEKKATELAILCDVPVCVIVKDNTDGRVSTVPQDRGQVVDILLSYKRRLQAELVVGNANSRAEKQDETWEPSFNNLPDENLMEFMKELEEKSEMVDEAIKRKEEITSKEKKGKGKRIHDESSKFGNKKAKGIVLDSKTNTSSSSADSDGIVLDSKTTNSSSSAYSDGIVLDSKTTNSSSSAYSDGIVLDSKTTNSSSSADSGLDSLGNCTISNAGFPDGVSTPWKSTEGTLAGEIDRGSDVGALPALTVRPVKLFGIFLN